MTFAFKTSALIHHIVLASVLATAGASVMAQGAPAGNQSRGSDHHMGHHDPAKMQAWVAQRQAEMKTNLKITPAQEGAWTAYTTALQTPMQHMRPTPEQRAEFDQLTTPQRIDKMRAVRAQHMTEMTAAQDKHDEATKTFYAALTPEQQKVFDAEHQKHNLQGKRGGPSMK